MFDLSDLSSKDLHLLPGESVVFTWRLGRTEFENLRGMCDREEVVSGGDCFVVIRGINPTGAEPDRNDPNGLWITAQVHIVGVNEP